MKIFTDDIDFAKRYFRDLIYQRTNKKETDFNFNFLKQNFFENKNIYISYLEHSFWTQCILVKEADKSQYDVLVEIMGKNQKLEDKTICLTGSSKKLHGFRNRPWKSEMGNIHLSVYLQPNIEVENPTGIFLALAAVSTLKAIEKSGNFKIQPKIKWVNDIFFDNSKVAGVLAHTVHMKREIKGVVLGIGINVCSKPEVEPTKFVPSTTSLNTQIQGDKITEYITFKNLIDEIKINYELILKGKSNIIIEEYKKNSMIIGKKVRIWSDPLITQEPKILHQGIVTKIGNNLELFIDNSEVPVIRGRPEILK